MASVGRLSVAMCVLFASGGCRCDEKLKPVEARLEVATSQDGPWSSTANVDLGEVWGQALIERRLFLRNAGKSAITLRRVDDLDAALRLMLDEGVLDVGEVRPLGLTFTPPSEALDFQTSFSVLTEREETFVTVELNATVIPLDCSLPETLDFGVVVPGAESEREVQFSNPTSATLELELGGPGFEQGEPLAFGVIEPLSARLTIPPHEQRFARYAFRPSIEGESLASMFLRAAPACAIRRVTLIGRSLARLVTWQPATVDCDWQQPGTERRTALQFTNQGSSSVTLSRAEVDGGAFDLPADSWLGSREVVIEPGATVTRDVVCGPPTTGLFEGVLSFTLDVASQPLNEVPLRVSGGGPRIATAQQLDFGLASQVPSHRWLRIVNDGAPTGAPQQVTRLRILRATVVPSNANTASGELQFDAMTPLEIEVGEELSLRVLLRPISIGLKAATITLETNDELSGRVEIQVTANVKAFAPCQTTRNENALEFGVVHATMPMTRSLVVRNTSPDQPCLIFGQLSPTTPRDYSTPMRSVELAPGGVLDFPIRFQPRLAVGPTIRPIPGVLELQLSDPNDPEVTVSLNGAAGPACLAILPGEINFGSVGPGAVTSVTQLRFVNHCVGTPVFPAPVVPLTLLAGNVVGDLNSFQLGVLPSIPANGLDIPYDGDISSQGFTMAPYTVPFELRYAPQGEGPHRGALIVQVQHNGITWKQVIPLRGRGDASRATEDSFTQGGGDAVDIVLVLSENVLGGFSNGVWTWSKQQLADKTGLLFAHLQRANSDFRLGFVLGGHPVTGTAWRGCSVSMPWVGAQSSPKPRRTRLRACAPGCFFHNHAGIKRAHPQSVTT